MKKLVTLLLALVATTALWAYDFEVDGIYYNILTDKTNEVGVTSGDLHGGYSGSVTIPASVTYNGTTYSVTSIGEKAFYGCTGLTSITIPNSVTSIGESAFYGCSVTNPVYNVHCFAYMPISYEGAYTIPEGIKQIAGGAFRNCSGLTSITIPNSVTSIGDGAFWGCSRLTSVTIPNSVTSIGEGAFYECSGLTSVTIGNSVTSIGDYAFCECESLKEVICYAEKVPQMGEGVFYYTPQSEATLYVLADALEDYKIAEQWKEFGTILPIQETDTDLENTHSPSPMANRQKVIRNGQLIILRDGKSYSVMGQEL